MARLLQAAAPPHACAAPCCHHIIIISLCELQLMTLITAAICTGIP
jgi:hypothetical protein